MAFSNITRENFTYIRNAPDEASDWVGKLSKRLRRLSTVLVLRTGLDENPDRVRLNGYVPGRCVLYTGEEARHVQKSMKRILLTVRAYLLNVRKRLEPVQ